MCRIDGNGQKWMKLEKMDLRKSVEMCGIGQNLYKTVQNLVEIDDLDENY